MPGVPQNFPLLPGPNRESPDLFVHVPHLSVPGTHGECPRIASAGKTVKQIAKLLDAKTENIKAWISKEQ